MRTTTIRVDTETHAQLVALSAAWGESLVTTVRNAVEVLRRQRFARQVADELEALRSDAEAWQSYLADSDAVTVRDGIDDDSARH